MQQNLSEYTSRNVQVFAMTYDSQETMAKFAQKYDLTYPLLGDEGSEVIKKLGLLNTEIPAGHRIHGVAYPGYFLVDEKGNVAERKFYVDYRLRNVPLGILTGAFNLLPTKRPGATKESSKHVEGTAWLDSATYRLGQVIGLNVEIDIEEGWHTYGTPIPDGFYATKLTVEPLDGVTICPLPLPKPRPFKVEGLDEQFHVHEGKLLARTELVFQRREGDVTVKATLEYQACNDRTCMPPTELKFEFPLKALPHAAPAR